MEKERYTVSRLIGLLLAILVLAGIVFAYSAVNSYRKMFSDIDKELELSMNKYILHGDVSLLTKDMYTSYMENNDIQAEYIYTSTYDNKSALRNVYIPREGKVEIILPEDAPIEYIVDNQGNFDAGQVVLNGGVISYINSSVLYDADGDILYSSGDYAGIVPKQLLYQEHLTAFSSSENSILSVVYGTDGLYTNQQEIQDLAKEVKDSGKETGRIDKYEYICVPVMNRFEATYELLSTPMNWILFYDVTDRVSEWRSDMLINGAICLAIYILVALVAIFQYMKSGRARTKKEEVVIDENAGLLQKKFLELDMLSMVDNAAQSSCPCEEMDKLRHMVEKIQRDTDTEVADD